ncbi:MAG: cytochrome d ubiquinol oxidase subunit II [Terriglobales bacterium]
MNIAWFWLLSGMLTAYAILDGYDLGVGMLHLWVARSNPERRTCLAAIGPVWNGNEVWLIAAGGMLVVSFPRVYAAGFSGFYLALMLVLWLLIARGVAIEFRGQIVHPLWHTFWDVSFALASLLLAFLLGVALGNVLRGLPVAADGNFQGTFALLLNPYALLTGMLSVVVLAWHGANYLRAKTEGDVQGRARRTAARLGWAVLVLVALVTLVTALGGYADHFMQRPLAWLFPLATLLALGMGLRSGSGDITAFRASSLLILGLMGSAAATVFPALLRSTVDARFSLTVYNAASSPYALRTSFIANVVGMLGVALYSFYVHRTFRGKVRGGEGHY